MRPKTTTPDPRTENLLHRKFNRLTAIGYAGCGNGRASWLWKCDCGRYKVMIASNVTSGHVKACGCLSAQSSKIHKTTHGMGAKSNRIFEYASWCGMKRRCSGKQRAVRKYYLDRGIKVCERFMAFEGFIATIGMRSSPDLTLDRIDNDAHYSCGSCSQCVTNGWAMNVRWATRARQSRNQQGNRMLTFGGVTKCAADWADETGIKAATIIQRMNQGNSAERVLTKGRLPCLRRRRIVR